MQIKIALFVFLNEQIKKISFHWLKIVFPELCTKLKVISIVLNLIGDANSGAASDASARVMTQSVMQRRLRDNYLD